MIINDSQKVNIITRAIIIYKDHLMVTKWQDGFSFLIGGRVDFGEPLETAIIREIYEETKMKATIKKLIYFNENIFHFKEMDYHEFGWYYLVEVDNIFIELEEEVANPDSSKLSIQFIPIDKLRDYDLRPGFLAEYLPLDYHNGFINTPRHVYSKDTSKGHIYQEMQNTLARRKK